MHNLSRNSIPTIADVREIQASEPFRSKSGAELRVPLALTPQDLSELAQYDRAEIARIGVDIRGLRIYYLHGAPSGAVAGKQFHRVRTEILFPLRGAIKLQCEDIHSAVQRYRVTPECAVLIPPFVLHSLTFESDDTILGVLANTLFDADDPRTHDTYSESEFHHLQDRLAHD